MSIIGALLAIGVTVDLALLDRTFRPDNAGWRALVVVAVAFAVGEAVVMHVELGKNAHSVSLAELTLTVGLFFLTPYQLIAARLLGGGLVLILVRRQRPLKLAFNLALWTCDVAIAAMVFHSLGGDLDASPVQMAVSAGTGALTAALVDSLAVNVVIAATSRELDLSRAIQFLGTCLLSAAGCVTGGLVCVAALTLSPWFVIPIAMVTAVYLYAFAKLASLRTQITNVRVLNDFADELGRTRHGQDVARTVLRRTAQVLRADRATLYVYNDQTGTWQLSDLREDGLSEFEMLGEEAPSVLTRTLEDEKPMVLRSGSRHPAGAQLLRQLGVRDAVLAAIRGEQDLQGVLVVANRQGEVNTFNNDDALLLKMLARHAGSALSNSRLVEQLDHDSQHDPLTGLANRSKFQSRLTAALEQATSVSVLLMDLDRFKEVNDTLGHHHGDLLLQLVAERLNHALRECDLLARLGGDEFAVLLTDVTADQAVATAERLLQALGQSVTLQGVQTDIGASIGVAFVRVPDADVDAHALLQRADVAMYAAKQGYTGVHLYLDELDGYSPRRLALAGGLRSAIEEGHLSLRYQPQSQLSDGGIVGVEALVRWEHPLYGEVAPDEFIAIAEQTGLIRELTRYVLDSAIAACARWARAGFPVTVSVNLSARNLLEPDLASTVQELLVRHGVTGRSLIIEITESHLMADPDRTSEVLRQLAAAGIRISIDDFGTGYSSLSYLKRLPVTEVKIDKSFVRDLATNDEDSAIIASITSLAHNLRLDVVAEGVEDAATLDLLRALGCDTAQGYHIARPMTAADLAIWMGRQHVTTRAPRLRPLPAPRRVADRRRSPGHA
jgi:diguanylate cyclase (GGDEF)-like protein